MAVRKATMTKTPKPAQQRARKPAAKKTAKTAAAATQSRPDPNAKVRRAPAKRHTKTQDASVAEAVKMFKVALKVLSAPAGTYSKKVVIGAQEVMRTLHEAGHLRQRGQRVVLV